MAEDTRWTGGVPSDEVLSAINRSTVLTSNLLQRTLISYELGQASVKSQSLRVDVAQPSPQEQLYITVHRRTFDAMELQYFSNGPQQLRQKSLRILRNHRDEWTFSASGVAAETRHDTLAAGPSRGILSAALTGGDGLGDCLVAHCRWLAFNTQPARGPLQLPAASVRRKPGTLPRLIWGPCRSVG